MRIAMWSGPRNLSTAMMYAFGARPDCAVWDEPFYAAYLKASGAPHPMAADIMAAYETDPAAVAAACTGPEPAPIWYQKHMCQHMLPEFPLDWMGEVTNVFMIRHPARVIASYHAKLENPNAEDVGLPRQLELYEHARRLTGRAPLVIDSADILANPRLMLSRLCKSIGVPYTEAMRRWPEGGNAADGIWGAHWYGAVRASTGFGPRERKLPQVPVHLRPVLQETLPIYQRLKGMALPGP